MCRLVWFCLLFSMAAARAQDADLAVEALTKLQNVDLNSNARLKETVTKLLDRTRGTPQFLRLVQHFKLTDQDAGLLEVASRTPESEAATEAIKTIHRNRNFQLLEQALRGTNTLLAAKTAEAMAAGADKDALRILEAAAVDNKINVSVRKQAVRGLAKNREGANAVIRLAKEDKLAEDLKFTAASELSRATWQEVKREAAEVLPLPQGANAQALPPISTLVTMRGDPKNGEKIYHSATAACGTCHQVNGQGVDFGPNLSEIGSKLGKDAIYEAILDPSAGVSFGYEAWQLNLKSGDEAYGLLVSETPDEISLKTVGGIVSKFKKGDVAKREQMKLSIMPSGLQQTMTVQELADLVEFLAQLKKPAGS